MTTILTILVLAVLFAVFAVIPREGKKDGRCFMCPIRKALGGCGECAASASETPAGSNDAKAGSRRGSARRNT